MTAPESWEGLDVVRVMRREHARSSLMDDLTPHRSASPVVPFLVGTAVGGVAGGLAGTLLSKHTIHLVAVIIGAVDRRLSAADRDELRFELLLQ